MPKRCSVSGCSKTNADGVSLYSFPRENLVLCQEWVDFVRVKRSDFLWPSHTSVVCSLHFDPSSFEHNIKEVLGIKCRLRLVDGAVPTIQTTEKKEDHEEKESDTVSIHENEFEQTEKEEKGDDCKEQPVDHEPFECNVEIIVDDQVCIDNENLNCPNTNSIDDCSYRCDECGEEFIKKRKFVQHVISHSSESQRKKDKEIFKSGKIANTEGGLDTQVQQTLDRTFFKCSHCGQEFSKKQELVHHLLSHSKEKLIENYEDHEILEVKSRIHKESELLSPKENLSQQTTGHLEGCSDQTLSKNADTQCHKCNECGKVFSRRSNLNQHLLKHTGVRPHNCNECGKQFFQRRDLTRHMVTHTGYQPYTCNECGKSFSHKGDLTRHAMNHAGYQPYKCDICSKTFSRRHDSEKHMFVHTDDRPYKCMECGKGFSQKSRLTQHMLNHTGERPHKCTECGKAYLSKLSLTRHLPVHAGYKPFECDECNKSFYRKDDLAKHMLVHTGNLPFSCIECGKMFARKQTLTVHMLTHTGERPHQCSECEATYKYKVDLSNHLKRKHNIFIPTKIQRNEEQLIGYGYGDHFVEEEHIFLDHTPEDHRHEENILNHHNKSQNSEEHNVIDLHFPEVSHCCGDDMNQYDDINQAEVTSLKVAPDSLVIVPRRKMEKRHWEKPLTHKSSTDVFNRSGLVAKEEHCESGVKVEPPDF